MDPSTPAPLAFDDCTIDFAGRRLLREGLGQPLEPKAFAVLALLAGTPGRVFTRDEILDAVWGHRHVTPGVLNRLMTLLRHALGEDAKAARYLHTVHGVGYRFDLPAAAPDAPPQAIPAAAAEAATMPAAPAPHLARRRASDRHTVPRTLLWLLPLLALFVVAGWQWWPHAPSAPKPAPERSIAVLPLVNASDDKGQQFFSDGLSESLINALSRSGRLKVIGRDSAFQFRGSKDDSRTIGRKLGVSYLLGGSVQHVGDVVRINAALTRAADGSTLWAEHYDRPYRNLFALQDEIASAVIGALQVKLLSPGESVKHDDRPPSGSIDAYNAYLQGLQHWHDEDFGRASEYMAKAVQLDPGYAMAWAHLSGSLSTVATFWHEPPAVAREQMNEARRAADQALQLAPGLGAAHASRAYLMIYSFDHRGALAGCRRAVQLAPEDGTVLNGCGYVFAQAGKLGEAIRSRQHLLSIEPLYIINYQQYAKLLLASGRLDEAEKYLGTAESLPQTNPFWRYSSVFLRMTIALARGDTGKAMSSARQMPAEKRDLYTAMAAQIGPDRAAADAALANALASKAAANADPYLIAQIYALRGDAGQAVEWLQRASGEILFLPTDPLVLNLRNDPSFIAFCARIGLPLPGESEALSIDQLRAANGARKR
jgi:TolB-like protein/DNA-binding winged helix-turn-helix (wHTH) protein/Tfp pilus assembly protein PilF